MLTRSFAGILCVGSLLASAPTTMGAIVMYGDQDVLGTGSYASDPTAGATLEGLAPGTSTSATLITGHGYPFDPGASDFAGTDQIYVGTTQTSSHDGYSNYSGRKAGPQVLTLDYSSIAQGGIATFTLGIAADDFQNVPFGQPFTASINGSEYAPLSNLLNSLNQTGPVVQFFTIGLPTSILTQDNTLVLSINQGGDGGDGWAVDFLSVGVTSVPTPATASLLVGAGLATARRRR